MLDEAAADEALGEDRPSRGLAYLMVAVGIVFLLPFIFLSLAGGVFFSLGGFVSALLTVGWTFGLGVVFLVYGWRRLRTRLPEDEGEA